MLVAAWVAAGATVLLAVLAAVTAVFAIKAFGKQSQEVEALEKQVSDQAKITAQQTKLLQLQTDRLDLQKNQLDEQRRQINTEESARQVDRVLNLHAEFSSGDIAEARNRFSMLMWRAGEAAFGPHKCWCPTWKTIYAPSPGCSEATEKSRFLGVYPPDMGAANHYPLNDLHKVLWCFERINVARRDQKDALNEQLVVALLGWEVIWFSLVCKRFDRSRGAIFQPLDQLADWIKEQKLSGAEGWDWMQGRIYDPHDDFLGDKDYLEREAFLIELASTSGL
jgi:hypothetical protein